MDIHLSYALCNVIWQLRSTLIRQLQTSLHQLEIEEGKYARTPLEEKIYQLCVIREWNWKNTIVAIVQFFMKCEGHTIASSTKALIQSTR